MRKCLLQTNLIIIVGSILIAIASIVFNYRLNYQERLEHTKHMLVNSAYLDLAEWTRRS